MNDAVRSLPKTASPSPRLVLPRPAAHHAVEVEPVTAPGEDAAMAPGHRLREIHAAAPERFPAASSEAHVAPELDYRVVLRCTAARVDH